MTLLELLVKELPKRGGWPKGIEKISQSPIDGELYLFKPCEILTGRGIYFFEVSDFCWTKVYKRQYEAAIAAQQTVWNGEGLPPVGAECEIAASDKYIKISHPEGTKVKIYACFTDDRGVELAAFVDSAGSVGGVGIAKCFRPIRAEAERKRDLAVGAMERSWESVTGVPAYDFEKIYDDIAAGKIPGVELSK